MHKNKEASWKRSLALVLMVALLSTIVFASTLSKNTAKLEYTIDQGIREDKINVTGSELAYLVRGGTYPNYINVSSFGFDMMLGALPVNITDSYNISNINRIRREITWHALTVRLNNSYGAVRFKRTIDLTSYSVIDLDSFVNLSFNHIEINTSAVQAFNKSAVINITGLSSFTNVRILKDSEACKDCTINVFKNGEVQFSAQSFSIYSAANGSAPVSIKLSTKVNITNASMNVTGQTYNGSYPSNVSIDIGRDNNIDYRHNLELNTTFSFNNFSYILQGLIGSCSCPGCTLSNSGLTCDVELNFSSDSQGTILMDSLNITQVIANVSWRMGNNYTLIDLDDYFYDRNNGSLIYNNTDVQNLIVEITDGVVTLVPNRFFYGVRTVVFNASDGQNYTLSNNVTLNILIEPNKPSVILLSPANGTNSSIENITLRVNASDDYGIKNCSLYHNISGVFGVNQSINLSGGESNIVEFNLTYLLDNTSILWNVECFDIHNNSNMSTMNWTVNIYLPPQPMPTMLNATQNASAVFIQWNSSVGATAYRIYAATNLSGDFVFLNQTTALNYTDYNASNFTTRYYKVTAIDNNAESFNDRIVGWHKYTLERKNGSLTKNWVAIAFNDSSLTKASQLLATIPNATSVVIWNATDQYATTCNFVSCPAIGCTQSQCDFDVEPGAVYEITINSTGPTAINFSAAGIVIQPKTINLYKITNTYSKNYLTIYTNSSIPNARTLARNITKVNIVRRWVASSQSTQYLLNIGNGIGSNFNVVPFEGYEIIPTANVTWSQS